MTPLTGHGPIEQLQEHLWSLLEANPRFAALVPPAGRVTFTEADHPDPAEVSVEALPRFIIEPAGWRLLDPAGPALRHQQTWRLVLLHGDRRTGLLAQLKVVVAAILDQAGPTLGLSFIESWRLARATEDPDSSDQTRQLNPRRQADRRRVAGGGRRVIAELVTVLIHNPSDLATWLAGPVWPPSQPLPAPLAPERYRLEINGAAAGDELLAFTCMGATSHPRLVFEIAVTADSLWGLAQRLANLRQLIARLPCQRLAWVAVYRLVTPPTASLSSSAAMVAMWPAVDFAGGGLSGSCRELSSPKLAELMARRRAVRCTLTAAARAAPGLRLGSHAVGVTHTATLRTAKLATAVTVAPLVARGAVASLTHAGLQTV